ncbi:hypothetical protein N7457_008343 [Penicillium paradoxum]|uniref:uncharacterized protein n=1 Tax=Penicillium paradoxum TaxID=176176 RepID=UPI0025472BD1|nr:uncharacterized protein N7457_008343 [Penicillium paradoxum]KAJ5773447.1 hypothetical protein N7457_008343 [Penicillium paradoxum]
MGSVGPETVNGYRRYLPLAGDPRIADRDTMSPYEVSEKMLAEPVIKELFDGWRANISKPYYGITTDGTKVENIYSLQDEGAPTQKIVAAANQVLESFTPEERLKTLNSLDSGNWRKWSNTEIIAYEVGVRLEHLQDHQVDQIWNLLKQSLSEAGYAKAQAAVRTNKFLGELCHSRAMLNDRSYFFQIFGQPSETEPWGYSFFGHHLVLNIFFVENQMVIGPAFIGAEPNIIDAGPNKGTQLFIPEAKLGLQLMQSLSPEQQSQAQIYVGLHDPAMPEDRWNLADQRHLAGTSQDNRVIPYEGVVATSLTPELQELLISIVAVFQELLPAAPLAHKLELIRKHLPETYFSWIGKFGDDDPYYYRIQSPVVLVEFDYHSGIYLTNTEPQKYHTHTIQRLPNGGDYATELIRQWKEKHAK